MITKDNIKPVVSLTLIVAVSALLLGLVYGVTKPIIEKRMADAEIELRQQVMLEADMFKQVEGVETKDASGRVTAVFEAYSGDTKIGYVVNASGPGYGGEVPITVGVDINTLTITGLRVGDNSETAGLGARITEPAFYEQFLGKSVEPTMKVNGGGPNDIDGVSSATISSKAVAESAVSALNLVASLESDSSTDAQQTADAETAADPQTYLAKEVI